jgi:hypothetical protein
MCQIARKAKGALVAFLSGTARNTEIWPEQDLRSATAQSSLSKEATAKRMLFSVPTRFG